MKHMNRVIVLVLSLVLLLGLTTTALAADGNVSYSGNAGKFVFEPGTDYSVTDLFPDLKDVMPGDTITQRIVLKNEADSRVNVRISMRALGAHHDSEEFLSQLQLTVTQVGKATLFDAPANETAQLTDWVLLGFLSSGGEVELEVSLTVPVTMGNEFQEQVGYLDWQFMAEETPSGYTPQTGDQAQLGLYVTVMVVALVAIVIVVILLVRKKKKEEE